MPKLTKLEDAINTRSELACIAGVSNGTYSKGKKILESDNEEVKKPRKKQKLEADHLKLKHEIQILELKRKFIIYRM